MKSISKNSKGGIKNVKTRTKKEKKIATYKIAKHNENKHMLKTNK